MLSLKSSLGKRSSLFRDEITNQRISAFCKAVCAPESHIAPPTFLTVFRNGEFELFQQLDIELARILHAEQEYQYELPIIAGDVIHFSTTLSHVLEKQGSSALMQFLTFETDFEVEKNHERQSVGKSKTTIVIRNSVK